MSSASPICRAAGSAATPARRLGQPPYRSLLYVIFPLLLAAAPAAEEDIRDIRNAIHIPYPWLWIVYVLAGLLIIGLFILAYLYCKRSKPARLLLPHEAALERLQSALALMKPEQAKEFSIEVSEAVRIYIEKRFQIEAAHKTTEEFLHNVTAQGSFLTHYSAVLEGFLNHCDLAKFAKEPLSPTQMQSMWESARDFIVQTQPQEKSAQPSKVSPPPVVSIAQTG